MNDTGNSNNYEYSQPVADPAVLQSDKDKKDFRHTVNIIGLMIIIATVVFDTFSTMVSFIYMLLAGNTNLPSFIDAVPDNVISGLANIAAIGICGLVFIKFSKKKPADILIFNKLPANKLWTIVTIGFTVCMISNLLTNMYLTATESLGVNLNLDIETPVSNSFIEIVVYFISTAIVPAFSEEILFRGAVLGTLRKQGDTFAIVVSSFLFGIFHANFVQFPFAFLVGLVLAWTVVYTNSMLPAIIIHAANNGFSVLCDILYTNADSLNLNESIVDAVTFIIVAAIAVAAIIFVINLSKKDKNFMKPAEYQGTLDRKTRTKLLVTSPLMIVSVAFLFISSIFTHIVVSLQ